MRLFSKSDTYALPDESVAIPNGVLNWPLAEPAEPQVLIKVPPLLNTWIRSLLLSTTYTLPEEPIARCVGNLNWPLAEPSVPHFLMKVPSFLNFLDTVIATIGYIHIARGINCDTEWSIE